MVASSTTFDPKILFYFRTIGDIKLLCTSKFREKDTSTIYCAFFGASSFEMGKNVSILLLAF
jgi:hypothetical protein